MIIQTEELLDSTLDTLSTSELIAFDFETLPSGLYPDVKAKDAALHHKMLEIDGLALRSETLKPVFIPFKDTEVSRIYLAESLKKLFSQESLFIAHNLQFDAKITDYFFGARPKNKFCTLVGYWYLDENCPKDAKTLGRKHFDLDMITFEEAKKIGKAEFYEYAKRDAEVAYQLYLYEKPLLEEEGFWELVSSLEMDFLDVLLDMTLYGTICDLDYLKKGQEILTNKAVELETKIYKRYGEFNLKSPMQLCEKLYGIKITRKNKQVTTEKLPGKFPTPTKLTKGKTQVPSTDEEALKSLNTPVANAIKEYRSIVTLLDTYAIGYQKWVVDGKIYPTFNHVGTVTGRLSSEKPNMQNISHEATEGWWLREAIHAAEGYDLIVADESQLEIRIMAHYSEDENLMTAIWSGKDVHLATANIIFNKEEISDEERRFAKTMNFSISYGQGIMAIAQVLGVLKEEAKRFRYKYFGTFPGVKQYIDKVGNRVIRQGYVKTILGRKRRIPEANSPEVGIVAKAKRQAVNSIIQGSASDVLKVAMVNINKEFKEKNLDAHILLQIHDELVVQSRKDHTEEACTIIKNHMEHPFARELKVPLLTKPKVCYKWSEGK